MYSFNSFIRCAAFLFCLELLGDNFSFWFLFQVMTIKETPKENRYFVMSVLKEMSLSGVSYSLANFNGAVDKMGGSLKNKTDAKDIATAVFDRGKLL